MSTQKFLSPTYITLDFLKGLKEIVVQELAQHSDIKVLDASGEESITVDCSSTFSTLKNLKSVARIRLMRRGTHLNPYYLSNHKSLLGDLIFTVLHESSQPREFATYKISCAGSDSKAVTALKKYVESTYKLTEAEEADLKIVIARPGYDWELSVQMTPRPLSVRGYKTNHSEGSLNPTIAYAINSLCGLFKAKSYLNIFSGSGTLLIEAAQINPRLNYVGFDHSNEAATRAIRNIQNAGFIKNITIKVADIFARPDFGNFDIITSDLPFGMKIAKGINLTKLYTEFIAYTEQHLNPSGKLIAYTSELATFKLALESSQFTTIATYPITITTSVDSRLVTYIIICSRKG